MINSRGVWLHATQIRYLRRLMTPLDGVWRIDSVEHGGAGFFTGNQWEEVDCWQSRRQFVELRIRKGQRAEIGRP